MRWWSAMRAAPLLLLLLVACGTSREPNDPSAFPRDGGSTEAPRDGGTADGGVRDAGFERDGGGDPATEPSDLGAFCPGGCNLATCVLEDEDCEGGVCIWHGALSASYCSRRCVTTCRPGYSCIVAADGEGPVCISDTPDCGNGNVEYGEACDDGNTDDGDFCAGDCSAETQPPSGGTVTTSFDGRPPMTSTGDDPVVYANRMGDNLFFGASSSQVTYRIDLPDDLGAPPLTRLLEAGLIESVGGSLCTYQGATQTNISRLDYAAKEVAGTAAFVMVCMGGNCEFGCNPEFTLEVSYDLRWVDD
ncbi:MAG: hypothetical protein RMA76_19855 [Deltaproteobacteria bacterium]